MKKHVIVSIVLSAGAMAATGGIIAGLAAARRRPKILPPRKIIPKVLAPKVQPVNDYRVRILGYGSVRPKVQVEIAPEISGKVTTKAANYLSGKYVAAGQMLFEIEDTDYRQAHQTAQRKIELLDAQLKTLDQEQANLAKLERIERDRLDLARKQYQTAKQLQARGAGTENEVDSALQVVYTRQRQLQDILNQGALVEPQRLQLKAQKRITEVEKAKAQTALSRCVVTSPFDGRVISCYVEIGKRVNEAQVCGEIYATGIMELPVSIPAGDLQWIDPFLLEACKRSNPARQSGERISATVHLQEPGTGRKFTWSGCVERIEAGLEAKTRTARLVVQVENPPPGNPDGATPLDINMFCKVEIHGKKIPTALLLPRRAIQPDGTVFLANGGKLSSRPVTVARFTNNTALILPGGGVEPGDRVINSYVPRAVAGMPVEAMDEMPAAAPADRP